MLKGVELLEPILIKSSGIPHKHSPNKIVLNLILYIRVISQNRALAPCMQPIFCLREKTKKALARLVISR